MVVFFFTSNFWKITVNKNRKKLNFFFFDWYHIVVFNLVVENKMKIWSERLNYLIDHTRSTNIFWTNYLNLKYKIKLCFVNFKWIQIQLLQKLYDFFFSFSFMLYFSKTELILFLLKSLFVQLIWIVVFFPLFFYRLIRKRKDITATMLKFTLFLISVVFLDCIVAAPLSKGKCHLILFILFFEHKECHKWINFVFGWKSHS